MSYAPWALAATLAVIIITLASPDERERMRNRARVNHQLENAK
jgi:hypothetical protein